MRLTADWGGRQRGSLRVRRRVPRQLRRLLTRRRRRQRLSKVGPSGLLPLGSAWL